MIILAEVVYGRWRLGIGDPTFIGWLTVAFYFFAVISCTICVRRHLDNHLKEATFWFAITLIMLFLGINKQLDLQSLMTEIGRSVSKSQGWYENRKVVQISFLVIMAILFLTAAYYTHRIYGEIWHRNKMASFGLIYLCFFIMIRAISFHGTDEVIDSEIFTVKLNHILELSGIVLVIWGGFLNKKLIPPVAECKDQTD